MGKFSAYMYASHRKTKKFIIGKKLKLVWDSQQFKVPINQTDIYIAPVECPPFSVKAIVEEQDTSLVLEPSDEIPEYSDFKPIWYEANTQALQKVHLPGEVIEKSYNPIRLLAIVHDFDCEPSWKIDWIKSAINNILNICGKKQLVSLALPVLGAQYGKLKSEEFLKLLVNQLSFKQSDYPQRIWLLVPAHDCQKMYEHLNWLVIKHR